MVNIVINSIRYPLPESWQELTLNQVQSLSAHIELFDRSHSSDPAERDESAAKILTEICGVPHQIAIQTDLNDRNRFAHTYCHQVMHMLAHFQNDNEGQASENTKNTDGQTPQEQHSHTGQQPQPQRRSPGKRYQSTFFWQGEWLRYPTSGTDINGDAMPMHKLSAVEFCEASDLYLADALGYAPLIVALLCRPSGESYSEQQARKRAQAMQTLPMNIVWHVFELLDQTHRNLKQLFPYCYASTSIHQRPQQSVNTQEIPQTQSGRCIRSVSPPTWNDMLLEAAAYRPGEMAVAEQMQLYDFMRLLNAKAKRYNRSAL